MRAEFSDAVTRQRRERDELLEAIMGYGQRRAAAGAQTVSQEELMRAILGGGAMAATGMMAR